MYHPMMTAHYALDWLTIFSLKDIHELLTNEVVAKQAQKTIVDNLDQTVSYVNGAMQAVMKNQKLIWGVSDHELTRFMGVFELGPFDQDQKSADIFFALLPQYQKHGVMSEILDYITKFAFQELELGQLTAEVPMENEPAQKILIHAGFKQDPAYQAQDIKRFVLTK